jgi:hypothetical protein
MKNSGTSFTLPLHDLPYCFHVSRRAQLGGTICARRETNREFQAARSAGLKLRPSDRRTKDSATWWEIRASTTVLLRSLWLSRIPICETVGRRK